MNPMSNAMILEILEKQVKNPTPGGNELIYCLVKCFNIAYPEDEKRELDEDEKNMRMYLETNFSNIMVNVYGAGYFESLLYSLEDAYRLDTFLMLFKQHYNEFFERIKRKIWKFPYYRIF